MSKKEAIETALREWFAHRGAIDKTKFEAEAGIPFRSLRDFLNKVHNLTPRNLELTLRRAQEYGLSRSQIEARANDLVKESRKKLD